MRKWSVYINGTNVGSVVERTEELARCVAASQFDIAEEAANSVNPR